MDRIEEKIMSLTQLPKGKEAEIIEIQGGHGLLTRLSAMGMLPGEFIRKCSYNPCGPQVCMVKGYRYGLGRGMADKIYVKYKDETK